MHFYLCCTDTYSLLIIGEMVGSSLHDEVGGELDKDHQAGVPTSPSPSGGFHQFL